MADVIQFFDPSPLVGVFQSCSEGCSFPAGPPSEPVELVDATLEASGELVLRLRVGEYAEARPWRGLLGVVEGEDGSMGLRLTPERCLVFPAGERDRVTALFMRLANNSLGKG